LVCKRQNKGVIMEPDLCFAVRLHCLPPMLASLSSMQESLAGKVLGENKIKFWFPGSTKLMGICSSQLCNRH
jgi:hypothetical protein